MDKKQEKSLSISHELHYVQVSMVLQCTGKKYFSRFWDDIVEVSLLGFKKLQIKANLVTPWKEKSKKYLQLKSSQYHV